MGPVAPPTPGRNPHHLWQQNTLRDALVAAITLDTFNRQADKLVMANIAQAVNVLQALFLTEEEKLGLTPTYHVFEMYQSHQGGRSGGTVFDYGDAWAGWGHVAGDAGLQGADEFGVHAVEVFFFGPGQVLGALAIDQLEDAGLAVVADQALVADQLVDEVAALVFGGVAVAVAGLDHRVSAAFVVEVEIDVVGGFMFIDPGADADGAFDFGSQPPARQVDLVDAAIDHRAAFDHAAMAAGVGLGAAGAGIELAMAIPEVDQAQAAHLADRAFADQTFDLQRNRREAVGEA